jgi:hypothetical protein
MEELRSTIYTSMPLLEASANSTTIVPPSGGAGENGEYFQWPVSGALQECWTFHPELYDELRPVAIMYEASDDCRTQLTADQQELVMKCLPEIVVYYNEIGLRDTADYLDDEIAEITELCAKRRDAEKRLVLNALRNDHVVSVNTVL